MASSSTAPAATLHAATAPPAFRMQSRQEQESRQEAVAKRLFGKAAMPHCPSQPTSSTLTTAPADMSVYDAAIQAPPVSLTNSDDESSDDSMDAHRIAASYNVAENCPANLHALLK